MKSFIRWMVALGLCLQYLTCHSADTAWLDRAISSLSPTELTAAMCSSVDEPEPAGRECTDRRFGGCENPECEPLFQKALKSKSAEDTARYEATCGVPKSCPVLTASEADVAKWQSQSRERAASCGLPPPEQSKMLLPGERTVRDLECWKTSGRLYHFGKARAAQRCAYIRAGTASCSSPPCPIPATLAPAVMSIKRQFCTYPSEGETLLFACASRTSQASAVGIICPPDAASAQQSPACAPLGSAPATKATLLGQSVETLTLLPNWQRQPGSTLELPGVAVSASQPQVRVSSLQSWRQCSDAEPSCDPMSAKRSGWTHIAQTTSTPRQLIRTDMLPGMAAPKSTKIPNEWGADALADLDKGCEASITSRHRCDWANIGLELLLSSSDWRPITARHRLDAGASEVGSVQCFQRQNEARCIAHTTSSVGPTQAEGRHTTEAWSPFFDQWQAASSSTSQRRSSLLDALLRHDSKKKWKVAAASSSGGLAAIATWPKGQWRRIDVLATGQVLEGDPGPALTRSVSALKQSGTEPLLKRAKFAVESLLTDAGRLKSTDVVESQGALRVCWLEATSPLCLDSRDATPVAVISDSSLSRLLGTSERAEVVKLARQAVADEMSDRTPNPSALPPLLRALELAASRPGPLPTVADAVSTSTRPLVLFNSSSPQVVDSAAGTCAWRADVYVNERLVPLELTGKRRTSGCERTLLEALTRLRVRKTFGSAIAAAAVRPDVKAIQVHMAFSQDADQSLLSFESMGGTPFVQRVQASCDVVEASTLYSSVTKQAQSTAPNGPSMRTWLQRFADGDLGLTVPLPNVVPNLKCAS